MVVSNMLDFYPYLGKMSNLLVEKMDGCLACANQWCLLQKLRSLSDLLRGTSRNNCDW